jgi:transposase
VIAEEVKVRIRRLHFAEGWPVGTIAAQLGVHHETVQRTLEAVVGKPDRVRKSKLDPFLPFIRDTLAQYPRLRSTRLFEMLGSRGYVGSAVQVRRVVRRLRPEPLGEAYHRLRTLPGEQGQADWGHFGTIRVGQGTRPLSAFVMVLSFSRAIDALFTLDQTLESFLRGHLRAFALFGGVPRTILYDNLKSVVLERVGDAIHFHPRVLELAGHYHFAPRPCAPARGNEKGKVERQIRYLRDSFFAARTFRDIDDLNFQFGRWRDEVAHQRHHPDEPEQTVGEVLAREKALLLALPEHPLETTSMRVVRSGKSPYVRFDRNDYSLPATLVRKPVTLVASATEVRILDGTAEVACHVRSYDTAAAVEDPVHVEALAKTKRAAASLKGRDRLRSAVPQAETLFMRLAERGENLGYQTQRLLRLLDDYGRDELVAAVGEALAKDALGAGSVAHILERRRKGRGLKPPLPLPLPNRPGVKELDVTPHQLEDYDELAKPRHKPGSRNDGSES